MKKVKPIVSHAALAHIHTQPRRRCEAAKHPHRCFVAGRPQGLKGRVGSLLFLLFMFFVYTETYGQAVYKLRLELEGLNEKESVLYIAIYNDTEQFLLDEYRSAKVSKDDLESGNSYTFYDLPEGAYAVSLYDDENLNGEMDTKFFFFPAEGYSFSRQKSSLWSKPDWGDHVFQLRSDTTLRLKMFY